MGSGQHPGRLGGPRAQSLRVTQAAVEVGGAGRGPRATAGCHSLRGSCDCSSGSGRGGAGTVMEQSWLAGVRGVDRAPGRRAEVPGWGREGPMLRSHALLPAALCRRNPAPALPHTLPAR